MTWQEAGGLEALVADLAAAFHHLGWKVRVVVAFGRLNRRHVGGVEVWGGRIQGWLARRLWERGVWKVATAWRLHRALASGGLLLCGHAHLLPVLRWLPRRADIRHWCWTYGIDVWGGQALRWMPQLNRTDAVVAISRFTAKELEQGGLRVPLRIVPPCVDVTKFVPLADPTAIRRDEILICGRLSQADTYKGHDVLFQSLALAERKLGRSLTIRVVGAGPARDRLQALASTLGIADRVRFEGRVSTEQLIEIYQHCGVFCMPSRVDRPSRGYWTGEGFGLVYAEAAACGRPVIASTEGGAPEALLPGESGLLVDPRSPEDVSNALAHVLSDPNRADQMGWRGRRFVEHAFSESALRRRLEAVTTDAGF